MASGYSGWKHNANLDWDGVNEGGGEAAPNGIYEAEVSDAQLHETSTKGDPAITIKLNLLSSDDGRCQAALNDGAIKTVYDEWVLTPSGMFRPKNFCRVASIEPPKSSNFEVVAQFCETVKGTVVPVAVRAQTYQGRSRSKVDFYGTERPKSEKKTGNGEAHPARPDRGSAAPARGSASRSSARR